MTGVSAETSSGMIVVRSRSPSKIMRTGSIRAGPTVGLSGGMGTAVAVGDDVDAVSVWRLAGAPGVMRNNSRKASSRYFGVLGNKSMRTIRLSSLRCAVSNSRYLPSGDQAMMSLLVPLPRKLTGRASPPATGATQTLRKARRSVTMNASHRESGDQVGRTPF